ncbi:unnamed protein product, partial [Staurois parvus]
WGLQAIGDHGAPVSLPKLKKPYEKGRLFCLQTIFLPVSSSTLLGIAVHSQRWTDNSWGPRAIGDHGAPVLAQTQKSL